MNKVLNFNRRKKMLISIMVSSFLLLVILIGSVALSDERIVTQLEVRNLAPSWSHPFGTDWLGRDMFTRTIKGLALSMGVGVIASGISVIIAVILGLMAATLGKMVDSFISWLIDLFLSVPHLIFLILIAFIFGGGIQGVIIGIALTHWAALARVIRAEVMQLRSADYIQISYKLGKSTYYIAWKHLLPHLLPQMLIGFFLCFPHAILHEAAITFLGLGLSPHQPAIGIILSESMRYLSTGMWWLAFFPGLCLLLLVRLFDIIGGHLRTLLNPYHTHE
ncbi:ABC transporter permease [Halalkalibacter sp. APA_J-10(15)]|uniref:ABC transporter permease n=1 Tax=unclassified Halalkalibacter TaxID=2893063 RepID=UPI001FF2E872|nr:ABC transporter permease [Halalkalibacter sp. APA_J-10(15)]MCK0472385.1 ABC transporter permease [Halalkalibacter sp. APA_J-10(15)]